MPNYEINEDGKSIRCRLCGRTSYNGNDVKMRYCGACHKFLDELRCDFCNCLHPEGKTYTARARIFGLLKDDDRAMVDGDGLWVACRNCEAIIENKQWNRLLEVAMHGHQSRELRDKIIFMYQGVFKDFTVVE